MKLVKTWLNWWINFGEASVSMGKLVEQLGEASKSMVKMVDQLSEAGESMVKLVKFLV